MKLKTSNLKELKTSLIGAILFGVGLYWFMQNIHGWQDLTLSNLYVPTSFTVGGIFFLLAPDKILNILFSKLKQPEKPSPDNDFDPK